jgi:predicted RNA-binding Zn-ribbon protein involved in translation (DUF1610 family)
MSLGYLCRRECGWYVSYRTMKRHLAVECDSIKLKCPDCGKTFYLRPGMPKYSVLKENDTYPCGVECFYTNHSNKKPRVAKDDQEDNDDDREDDKNEGEEGESASEVSHSNLQE